MLICYFNTQLSCMSTNGHILPLMELASDKSVEHFRMKDIYIIVFFCHVPVPELSENNFSQLLDISSIIYIQSKNALQRFHYLTLHSLGFFSFFVGWLVWFVVVFIIFFFEL